MQLYKKVYDADPDSKVWQTNSLMDGGGSIFKLLDQISKSGSYNAILPYNSVNDAKDLLKRQIASYVGDQLSGVLTSASVQIKDVLAEIRTLRSQFIDKGEGESQKKYLAIMRYLLEDSLSQYRQFLEKLFGSIDHAVSSIINLQTLDEVVTGAKFTIQIVPDDSEDGNIFVLSQRENVNPDRGRALSAHSIGGLPGPKGSLYYTIYEKKIVVISTSLAEIFNEKQKNIASKTIFA